MSPVVNSFLNTYPPHRFYYSLQQVLDVDYSEEKSQTCLFCQIIFFLNNMQRGGRSNRRARGGRVVPPGDRRKPEQPPPAAVEPKMSSNPPPSDDAEPKLKSKRARIERNRSRAQALNESRDWFGLDRDVFASVTSLVDPEPQLTTSPTEEAKKSTFTGFRELPVRDILVILGLWFVRLLVPWVGAWHEFNLHLLADPSHLAQHDDYFTRMAIVVFAGKCALCLGFAILVDLINFKYHTFLILLLLYLSAPVTGVFIIDLLSSRGFDRGYYHEWWHRCVVIMMCAMSVPFITFPLQFSCIFNQVTDMSRLAHYNWISIFVFIEVVNATIAYWAIPPNCPTGYFTLVAVWAIIGAVIWCLAIEVFSLTRCATPEIKRLDVRFFRKKQTSEPSNEVELKTPESSDMKSKPIESTEPSRGLRMRKLLWFLLMLVPILNVNASYAYLERTRPQEDWDSHVLITATGTLIYGQCLVCLVTLVLFIARKWFFSVVNPDVLALGLPLLINVVALITILGRLVTLSRLQPDDVILGPVPTGEVSVIEFFNVEFRNRTVCVHSEHFGSLKVPPRQRIATVIQEPGGGGDISFNVSLDPRTNPPIITNQTFTYAKGVMVSYVLTLAVSDLVAPDISAFYSKIVVLKVKGSEGLRPNQQPQVVIINTYVNQKTGWYYNVTGPDIDETIPQVDQGVAILRKYPPASLEITYWTEFEQIVKLGNPPITVSLLVENYCVYVALLCLYDTHKNPSNQSEPVPRSLIAHKTMEIAGPASDRLPTKEQLERDVVLIVGMALVGMSKAGVYVGYLYLFWLDYPFTSYRTTFLAGLWVVMAVPEELARIKVIDVSVKALIVLLVLQLLCTALHCGASIFLYSSKLNFRNRTD